jgi:hypothetical protein
MNVIAKTKNKTTSADKGAPNGSGGWLGTPVLIPGEDATAFEQFADRIRAALKPSNAIEEIYVDDAIFHGWEVRRWRRAKGGLLWASSPAALKRALDRFCAQPLADTLMEGWTKRDPAALAKIESVMESVGLAYDVTLGEAMAAKIDIMAGLDALSAAAEGRFTTSLKEFERYRAGTAQKVRDIVDAEFEDVKGPVNGKCPHAK